MHDDSQTVITYWNAYRMKKMCVVKGTVVWHRIIKNVEEVDW